MTQRGSKRTVQRDRQSVVGHGRIPSGVAIELLSPQERLESGPRVGTDRRERVRSDRASAVEFAQHASRNGIRHEVHPLPARLQLYFTSNFIPSDINERRCQADGVRPGSKNGAEHCQARPSCSAQRHSRIGIALATPPPYDNGRRHCPERARAVQVA